MRADPCEERHALYLKLYVAVEAIYEARERYAAAKERKAANALDLHRKLADTRETERKLAEELREHVEKHGCIH
jgi:hypothetical protein